jgi:putative transposase
VKRAEEYRWSSAGGHGERVSDPVLSQDCHIVKQIKDWSGYLREKEEVSDIEEIRQSTKTGRPCGDDHFIQRLEKMLGRRLGALSWGRPRKDK